MRVLHILNDVTDRGNGIVNTVVDLAVEQAHQGYEVAIASAGGGYEAVLEEHGVRHLALDQSRRALQLLRAAAIFRRQLVDFRPDVVHAHMRTGLLLAWFWHHFREFALISHIHNVHDRESLLMGLADRVIAVSQSVAATMTARGIPRRKLAVVLNRTLGSPRQARLADIAPAMISRPSIVTVCGLTQRKGVEELIAAFDQVGREFPDAHLYFVGDGPERHRFEQVARGSPHSSRIHFEGFQSAPQAYMLSADVFVLAARRESFGLVLIEAREVGCPIVATRADGTAEALDDGRAGVLIPPRDISALAGALRRMLGSEQEREEWRARAHHGVENYRVDRMVHEVGEIYAEIVEEKNRRQASNLAWLK